MARFALLSLVLLAGLPACKDTPSYRLRWSLLGRLDTETDPDPPAAQPDLAKFDVTMAYHCSQFGVTDVRVTAIDELGGTASEDVYPCFPEGFEDREEQVEGPELRPGTYALEVRGVQRNLAPWIDQTVLDELLADADYDPDRPAQRCAPHAEDVACRLEDRVCDCQLFEAVEDETFGEFREFVLPAPIDCVDGVDNDADGLLDAQDPGCTERALQESAVGDCVDEVDNDGDGRVDADDADCFSFEKSDVSIVQFTLRVTLLDGNTSADCTGIGLTTLRVRATAPGIEDIPLATLQCRAGDTLFFSSELPASADDYTIEITGYDKDGTQLTEVATFDQPVAPDSDAIIAIEVDFGEADFLEPVVEKAQFALEFSPYPNASETRTCNPGTSEGTLAIEQLSLRLVDLAGEPVDGVGLSLGSLDGAPFDCTTQRLTTMSIPWGGYRVLAEARAADGTTCFRSDPDGPLLAPARDVTVVLDRVLVGDAPPSSCVDCSSDADCGVNTCERGICR